MRCAFIPTVGRVHVHADPSFTQRLLKHVDEELHYDAFLVEEICGVRVDCRNLLLLPRDGFHRFQGSATLDLAVASGSLYAVDARSIGHFAYPCCRDGGECCPTTRQLDQFCCTHKTVQHWLGSVLRGGGADLQWYTRTRWQDQPQHTWGRARALIRRQEEVMNRSLELAGFSNLGWSDVRLRRESQRSDPR